MSPEITASRCLPLIDLTSLNVTDTPAAIERLVQQADTPFGQPAALCVYPEHIFQAKQLLRQRGLSTVQIATVTNFPDGSSNLQRALDETQRAVAAGADEIDLVLPYGEILTGNYAAAEALVRQVREVCPSPLKLKVIIESGILETPELIASASDLAIDCGADFIKTSTGKVEVNATLDAAQVMLERIKLSGQRVGFKAAGGIRTVTDAAAYLELATEIMGEQWLQPESFRFGASGLLADIQRILEGQHDPSSKDESSY